MLIQHHFSSNEQKRDCGGQIDSHSLIPHALIATATASARVYLMIAGLGVDIKRLHEDASL